MISGGRAAGGWHLGWLGCAVNSASRLPPAYVWSPALWLPRKYSCGEALRALSATDVAY